MPEKKAPLAIVYDFDGTLAPGNMQERDLIPALGLKPKEFWKLVKENSKKHEADEILSYMRLMLEHAQSKHVQVRKTDFESFGKNLNLFQGLLAYQDKNGDQHDGWFDRINVYARASGVKIDHFIVSSGMREMVSGTEIAKYFRMIYASAFMYDHHGVAVWPALALNYTTKTQYLFRINKGSLHVYDHSVINKFVEHKDRPIPFTNIAFIGDGETDVPCFRLVTEQGGNAIAVYKPNTSGAKARCQKYVTQGRAKFIAPADYRDQTEIDRIIKALIDKLSIDLHLENLTPKLSPS